MRAAFMAGTQRRRDLNPARSRHVRLLRMLRAIWADLTYTGGGAPIG